MQSARSAPHMRRASKQTHRAAQPVPTSSTPRQPARHALRACAQGRRPAPAAADSAARHRRAAAARGACPADAQSKASATLARAGPTCGTRRTGARPRSSRCCAVSDRVVEQAVHLERGKEAAFFLKQVSKMNPWYRAHPCGGDAASDADRASWRGWWTSRAYHARTAAAPLCTTERRAAPAWTATRRRRASGAKVHDMVNAKLSAAVAVQRAAAPAAGVWAQRHGRGGVQSCAARRARERARRRGRLASALAACFPTLFCALPARRSRATPLSTLRRRSAPCAASQQPLETGPNAADAPQQTPRTLRHRAPPRVSKADCSTSPRRCETPRS